MNEKKKVFRWQVEIREGKEAYTRELKLNHQQNNTRDVWSHFTLEGASWGVSDVLLGCLLGTFHWRHIQLLENYPRADPEHTREIIYFMSRSLGMPQDPTGGAGKHCCEEGPLDEIMGDECWGFLVTFSALQDQKGW